MKVYIIHYTKLTDRKPVMLGQMRNNGITDFEFIEKCDKEDLTDTEISIFQDNFNKSLISIFFKHIHAYGEIIRNHDYALILEDDALLQDNFINILNEYMKQLPEDFDMFFIGSGCNLHIEKEKILPNKFVYEKCLHPTWWGGLGASRCADSYIVSKKCAIAIFNYLMNMTEKIDLGMDHWISHVAREKQFKVYWAEPSIVTQGSEVKFFKKSY